MNSVRNKKLKIFADLRASLLSNGMKKVAILFFSASVVGVFPFIASAQSCGGLGPCSAGQTCVTSGDISYCATDSSQPSTNLPQVIVNKASGATPLNSAQGKNLGYTPLEPIPGLTSGNFDVTNPANLPILINAIFTILVSVGALFSVAMLTLSGIRYMLSDIVTDKERAKLRIRASLYGLLLIVASWLILHTINPQLLNFTFNPGGSTVASQANNTTGNVSQTLVNGGASSGNLQADTNTCTQRGGAIKITGFNEDGSSIYQCITP